MIEVGGYIEGGEEALGTAQGILQGVSTNLFKDDIVRMFYSYMSIELGQHVDRAARTMPEKYEHMYDWGMLGLKSGRLWEDKLFGGSGKRYATFYFKPSRVPVPKTTPQNTGIRSSVFPNLSDRKYVFVNKAMVSELGITTHIKPKNHDKLFIPLRHRTRSGWRDTNFGGKLRPNDIKRGFVWASRATQTHEDTAGNFTSLYELFYATQGDRVFEERVRRRVEAPIRKVYLANMPKLGGKAVVSRAKRRRVSSFSVRGVANYSEKVKGELRTAIKAERARADMEESDEY